MTDTIDSRLKKLGISIPEAAAPAANYVPFAQSGSLLLTSGQLPLEGGKLVHILAQAKAALGDLGRIKRIVKITAFVASTPDFVEQHLVANGASDLLVAVLGDAGKHARSAVGVASLPLNAPVEIEAIIEVA